MRQLKIELSFFHYFLGLDYLISFSCNLHRISSFINDSRYLYFFFKFSFMSVFRFAFFIGKYVLAAI